jgi:arylsulfatase A-like enzyme
MKVTHIISIIFLVALTMIQTAHAAKPNVLFICIDDLRPQLGCYGNTHMVTPNLDKFASQGRLFNRHYVQVPTCGASRFSMLTGLRPKPGAAMGNGAFSLLKSDNEPKRAESFPHLFRKHGYTTISIGKISHQPDGHVFSYDGKGDGHKEMPYSWDRAYMPIGKWKTAWNTFFAYADGTSRTKRRQEKSPAPPTEAADVSDEGYPDGLIAKAAQDELTRLKDKGEPFMLAVGFFKPHLPFNAPKKYWDLYDRDKLPLSPNPDKPDGTAARGWHGSGEMFAYTHPKIERSNEKHHHRKLRHAYYAAVSYIDAQVGKVLTTLSDLKLADDTIVVIWGDHGWHLGDQAVWGKHTVFERALRSAFIVRVPGMKHPGKATNGIVESLDIFPTLAQLCNLKAPKDLGGKSFKQLLDDPKATGKDAAFGYWRGAKTVRTDRYRLTQFSSRKKGSDSQFVLFDHKNDPNEKTDVAGKFPDVVAALKEKLQ